jgi:hypothetical protein
MVRSNRFRPALDAARQFALTLRQNPTAGHLLILLVSATGVAVAIPVGASLYNDVATHPLQLPAALSLGTEGGLAERFNHLMLLATSGLLLYAGLGVRSVWLVFFALAYAFALVDDALMYHERMGGLLARTFDLQPRGGLSAKDVGELVAWGLAGMALLIPAGYALRRRSPLRDGRAGVLIVLFGALTFFGIVMDVVHSLIGVGTLGRLSGVVEDGGEMLVAAVTCTYAFTLAQAPRRAGTMTVAPGERGRPH